MLQVFGDVVVDPADVLFAAAKETSDGDRSFVLVKTGNTQAVCECSAKSASAIIEHFKKAMGNTSGSTE
jgi:hypothetical protein